MDQIISELTFKTPGKGLMDITPSIKRWVEEKNILKGIMIISTQHTSCSLTINENADPRVLKDLNSYLDALVPEECYYSLNLKKEKKVYLHSEEGPDDMPAHIKTSLTSNSLNLSIINSKIILGTWQGIYLWEHRDASHNRKVLIHSIGEYS